MAKSLNVGPHVGHPLCAPGGARVWIRPFASDEQIVKALTWVVQSRMQHALQMSSPDFPEQAEAIARDLLRFARECGDTPSLSEVTNGIRLGGPSQEECEALKDCLSQMISTKRPPRESAAYHLIKVTAGRLWSALRVSVGLPPLPPDVVEGNAADIRG